MQDIRCRPNGFPKYITANLKAENTLFPKINEMAQNNHRLIRWLPDICSADCKTSQLLSCDASQHGALNPVSSFIRLGVSSSTNKS